MNTMQILLVSILALVWICSSLYMSMKRRRQITSLNQFGIELKEKYSHGINTGNTDFHKPRRVLIDPEDLLLISERAVYSKQVVRTYYDKKCGNFYHETSPTVFIATGVDLPKSELLKLLKNQEKRELGLEEMTEPIGGSERVIPFPKEA